jgi:glycogen operon protein
MNRWYAAEGTLFPLGVSWIEAEQAYNFAIYSKHATDVTLLLYHVGDLAHPAWEYHFNYLKNKSGRIWHCRVPLAETKGAQFYGYRIGGPNPESGFSWHNFDAEKILLDPYAKAVFFPPGFDRRAASHPGSNAGRAPLALLHDIGCSGRFDWSGDRRPRHDADLVIYEMHVKGFTRHPNSGVDEARRGTFLAVIDKIPYLQELGITAVELMPIFQFDPQDDNYWGYMPINFFAPHNAYATDPLDCRQHEEFRQMVRALHQAQIEVILDVVYNHTGEGDQRGPTYSLKGIDNTTYYMVTGNHEQPYANYSGTGNTLHTANRAVRRLIIDSLRYWVTEMHVDGFRFDLASIFTRNPDGSAGPTDPPIYGEIAAHPELADIRLIAEPWDACGLFQLGQRFPGTMWMQWNSAFRDTLHRFIRGDSGLVPDLMTRLYGSADLFPDVLADACHAYQSVNYVTSHDGFTLYDLVSYNQRNNWANGHNNTDGANDYSWNCGWEGDDNMPPPILNLRKRQVKNLFCLLMLSAGTPMFRMGDEFLQTQQGNNNPYNQDNEITWLDWRRRAAHRDVFRFFQKMIAFRKRHPSLSRSRFWRDDVTWYGSGRYVDLSPESKQLAFVVHGCSQRDADIYALINSDADSAEFGVHEGNIGEWMRVVDTSLAAPNDIVDPGQEVPVTSHYYTVQGRSAVVLVKPSSLGD